MAWHSIVTKGEIWDSSLNCELFSPGYRCSHFLSFSFFNGNWDWADTPYVHDAHSTWLFRMQQISNVFFVIV